MELSKEDDNLLKKEDETMNATTQVPRPCTIQESIIQSCKEVKEMREGKSPKNKLSELFANIEKWSKEEA